MSMHYMKLARLASPDSSLAAMNCRAIGLEMVAGTNHETVCEIREHKLRMQNSPSRPSSELVSVTLLLALTLSCLDSNLLVILLKCGEIFAGLGELALLHAFSDIPMDKRTLRIHEIELVVNAREDLGNGGAVGNHAASAHHLGQVTTWDHGRRLVVDATFKSGRTPVDKLNGALRLNGGNRGVHILGHHVPTVNHATGHVLAVARVALYKHRGRLEHRHRNLSHTQLFMVGLLRRDDGCVAREHEVDPGIWHQVCLELGDIHIEGAVPC